jgi:hypothetical protein
MFNTYKEAIEHHTITGMALNIKDHPRSLEKILRNGDSVKVLGNGSKYYPGCPSGNQILYKQHDLHAHLIKNPTIPIFHTFTDGKVEYLGRYVFSCSTKKMSFSGFTYFEYTFHRYRPLYKLEPRLASVAELPSQ